MWGAHHKPDGTITVSENILESRHDYVGRSPQARRHNNYLRKYSRTVTRLCGALTTSQTRGIWTPYSAEPGVYSFGFDKNRTCCQDTSRKYGGDGSVERRASFSFIGLSQIR
ncbi:hypothetical protein RRG08_056231 [Elysia crispata]|uniref:Uncharacterized protein n=1 Tax=Elysia crispata TaxID=231223 RepID=A0AAE0YLU4_9GAST|nr:hypothetical protein RRG08_056231 [Elysia crispata]